MGKTWVLDSDTKGTGAHVVPLEKLQKDAQGQRPAARPVSRVRAPNASEPEPISKRTPTRTPRGPVKTTTTPLPPGHVRKKATGEIGKVRSVDPQAGTASVHWLKRGAASTVPLSAISRR
jgi:hypothetical protein